MVRDTNALRGGDTHQVEVELRPQTADLWPLIDAWGLELHLPGWATPPFGGTRNRDVQDAWLAATGLPLGPPLAGW